MILQCPVRLGALCRFPVEAFERVLFEVLWVLAWACGTAHHPPPNSPMCSLCCLNLQMSLAYGRHTQRSMGVEWCHAYTLLVACAHTREGTFVTFSFCAASTFYYVILQNHIFISIIFFLTLHLDPTKPCCSIADCTISFLQWASRANQSSVDKLYWKLMVLGGGSHGQMGFLKFCYDWLGGSSSTLRVLSCSHGNEFQAEVCPMQKHRSSLKLSLCCWSSYMGYGTVVQG